MKNEVIEEKIYNIVNNQLEKNMLSHAYLIEKGNYKDIEKVIKKIVKMILCPLHGNHNDEKCNLCYLIDTNQTPDFKEIYPIGNTIRKEQLLEIKQLFRTKSLVKNRIYVIYEADKLNVSAANTILKFLEEPEAGIIAFLVTESRYQVLETLVSRCQILSIYNNSEEIVDEHIKDLIQKITTNSDFYFDFKELLEEYFPDKRRSQEVLTEMELYFHNLLIQKVSPSNEHVSKIPETFTNLSNDSIIKYILVLEEEKQKLVYNVNQKLWLDNLLVRFLEIKK